ncbi:uncharacterized protein LOC134218145 [Armigeres subalbatus]|uniref:uncharacterized protein LOC134218145 n=1 Tax=Armigeres subalbatus TaxID=124917 RepID=UPI002ED303A5
MSMDLDRDSHQPDSDAMGVPKIESQAAAVTLKQCKKLSNAAQDQYIKLRGPDSTGSPYSAKLRCGDAFWKLHGEGSLVTIGSNYLARVSIETIPELEDASDFDSAKELLLTHLQIGKVFLDELENETTHATDCLKTQLQNLAVDSTMNKNSAVCLLELWRIAEKHNFKLSAELVAETNTNELIHSNQLKVSIEEYVNTHRKLQTRNPFLKGVKWVRNLFTKVNILEESLKTVTQNYKNGLLKICNSHLREKISEFEPHRCFLLRKDDIKLFSDLECTISDQMFCEVLPKIETKFAKQVAAIKKVDYYESLPLVNGVYFHICKSMIEIMKRIEMELNVQDILEYENEWKIYRLNDNQVTSKIAKCLVKQLEMLASFANHYEPGKPTVKQCYPYDFQSDIFKQSKFNNNDFFIWFCLVDATVMSVFQENTEKSSLILDLFYKCVSSKQSLIKSQESIRMVAHNTIDYVVQVEQSGNNDREVDILQKQIASIGLDFTSSGSTFTRYRDITDVFRYYWERINEVIPKLSTKLEGNHLMQQVEEITNKLSIIASQTLDKNAPSDDVTKFFRIYNDLFTDLEDMNFEWYVRIDDSSIKRAAISSLIIQEVDNRLTNTDNACYQVKKGENDRFVKMFTADSIPKHYQIEVFKTLLDEINRSLQKQEWANGEKLTISVQINVTGLLINAIRSSLLYLKEQPDYIDFETFYDESVKPFSSVIDKSDSLENFTKRVELVKESFWYIRNQTAIGIDKALELSKTQNSFNENLLSTAFRRYNEQFKEYMTAHSKISVEDKIKRIVLDVRSNAKPMLTSKWTTTFKLSVLPTVLAGLGAVWSLMVSNDVASTGKYLKPHTIQVLSILRLLSVDVQTIGIDKHLAQIMTGQGKSLVLALIAAVLALFNHDVVIACYSSYLAERDEDDFTAFFQAFSIDLKIRYEQFDKMLLDGVENLHLQANKYLSKYMGVSNRTERSNVLIDFQKTVLLFDEVDVFFSDTFYGSSFHPIYTPLVGGLGRIQQRIWELVQLNADAEAIENKIFSFLATSNNSAIIKLKKFLSRPRRYSIFDVEKEREIQYTNKELFNEHLEQMIHTAIDIHHLPFADDWFRDFRLDSNGNITVKDKCGIYSSTLYRDYYNTFAYFKLRKRNFIQTANGTDNFGYLCITFASFSYAKFPERYPLILGVTGTLDGMSEYEKDAIENHYNIRRSSIMPSFFGNSNLKFNQQEDFQYHRTVDFWMKAIFSRVNAIISADRSVIVFFENDFGIAEFKQLYQSQLDRLHEITINTDADTRDRYIAEAGLSRTITLASREMGRGVDYKSSLAVEKNGGIHVIQTFFSLDNKEETQIRGRTARKDNRGSYELIVCRHDLVRMELEYSQFNDEINYEALQKNRQYLIVRKSWKKMKQLDNANAKHQISVQFWRSKK